MKIRINDLYLAEGGAQSPAGLTSEGTPLTERSDPARGQGPAFFDRRLRAHTDNFAVTRLHASLAEAENFVRKHSKAIDADAVGVIEFIAETDSGGAGGKWSARGRVLRYSAVHTGVTTIFTYAIEYGALA